MSEEYNHQKPCIHCSKLIASDAVYCSYCGKEQKSDDKNKLPSQWRLFILNLICPGGGDWYLGERLRATIIFVVVIGSLIAYCADVMPIIQKAVNKAVLHANFKDLNNLEEQISGNIWGYVFTISYIFAILDSFFLLRNKRKLLEEEKDVSEE